MATDTKELDLYGVDPSHQRLKDGYETGSEYEGQGDTRVIKFLLFPVHVKTASPMFPDLEVFQERLLKRGDRVTVQELGLIALEKGERLGAFFTSEELRRGVPGLPAEPVKVSSEELETGPTLSEYGPGELVTWLEGGAEGQSKAPAINAILEAVGTDKDLAKRMIDAENTRDKDDPRKSLLNALGKVVEA